MTGNVRSGVTVTVSSSSNTDMRVMQPSRGLPSISIEHEPHLPALQFQRTARSGVWVACRRWMTSSTTSPSLTSTWKSSRAPPVSSPRQTRKRRSRAPAVPVPAPPAFGAPPAARADLLDALLQLGQPLQRLLQFTAPADDADQVTHDLLQLGVQRVRVLAALAPVQRGQRGLHRRVELGGGDPVPRVGIGE